MAASSNSVVMSSLTYRGAAAWDMSNVFLYFSICALMCLRKVARSSTRRDRLIARCLFFLLPAFFTVDACQHMLSALHCLTRFKNAFTHASMTLDITVCIVACIMGTAVWVCWPCVLQLMPDIEIHPKGSMRSAQEEIQRITASLASSKRQSAFFKERAAQLEKQQRGMCRQHSGSDSHDTPGRKAAKDPNAAQLEKHQPGMCRQHSGSDSHDTPGRKAAKDPKKHAVQLALCCQEVEDMLDAATQHSQLPSYLPGNGWKQEKPDIEILLFILSATHTLWKDAQVWSEKPDDTWGIFQQRMDWILSCPASVSSSRSVLNFIVQDWSGLKLWASNLTKHQLCNILGAALDFHCLPEPKQVVTLARELQLRCGQDAGAHTDTFTKRRRQRISQRNGASKLMASLGA
eukprot:TRINITY_DN6594_c0_g1_i1.p1 TRINITY_DN6594_c0_g1~~TRINITY_DN6594_c0_g1_i1.p1  ORF type:complete len:427 (+),score=78.37 TRINITY_DN6594_c0_g1_i1:70-1281(+)